MKRWWVHNDTGSIEEGQKLGRAASGWHGFEKKQDALSHAKYRRDHAFFEMQFRAQYVAKYDEQADPEALADMLEKLEQHFGLKEPDKSPKPKSKSPTPTKSGRRSIFDDHEPSMQLTKRRAAKGGDA